MHIGTSYNVQHFIVSYWGGGRISERISIFKNVTFFALVKLQSPPLHSGRA